MVILSNKDGLFRVGNIEKIVVSMKKRMSPRDWLLQEIPDDNYFFTCKWGEDKNDLAYRRHNAN